MCTFVLQILRGQRWTLCRKHRLQLRSDQQRLGLPLVGGVLNRWAAYFESAELAELISELRARSDPNTAAQSAALPRNAAATQPVHAAQQQQQQQQQRRQRRRRRRSQSWQRQRSHHHRQQSLQPLLPPPPHRRNTGSSSKLTVSRSPPQCDAVPRCLRDRRGRRARLRPQVKRQLKARLPTTGMSQLKLKSAGR